VLTEESGNLAVASPEVQRAGRGRSIPAEVWWAAYPIGNALGDSDPTAARQLFERAAALGNEVALANLGVLAERTDPDAAIGYWRRASELGHVGSMRYLAEALTGTQPDEAARWLATAADEGDVDAAVAARIVSTGCIWTTRHGTCLLPRRRQIRLSAGRHPTRRRP
jgi:TPR repeat protein